MEVLLRLRQARDVDEVRARGCNLVLDSFSVPAREVLHEGIMLE